MPLVGLDDVELAVLVEVAEPPEQALPRGVPLARQLITKRRTYEATSLPGSWQSARPRHNISTGRVGYQHHRFRIEHELHTSHM